MAGIEPGFWGMRVRTWSIGHVLIGLLVGLQVGCAGKSPAQVPIAAPSPTLHIALVVGDGPALAAVEKLLREPRTPRFREWCFVNAKNQDKKECKPTRSACEEDALNWLGVKVRCDGRY